MYEFKLPDLGEGIHEGELLSWHVAEGEPIREDDPLCDMETDKAAVTIPSPRTGTVHQLGAQPGDIVSVGSVLVVIDDGSKAAESEEGGLQSEPAAAAESADMETVTGPGPEKTAAAPHYRAVAAPATRRLAREMGIDINRVPGTGPGGRVTREDLERYGTDDTPLPPEKPGETTASGKAAAAASDASPTQSSAAVPAAASAASAPGIPFLEVSALPDFSAQGPVEILPVRSLRKKVASKTTSSAILVPHVAHMDEVDVTELEALRRRYNRDREPAGRLTLLAFVIKAVASLLKKYSAFNASLDSGRMEIVLKKFYHIGFAADTPRGLMVPVVRDADDQSLEALGFRIRHLAEKAREDKVTVEDLTGGTFSVTNVGAIGGTGVLPIINYPETAILGMGRVAKKPVVVDDAVVVRQILPVTLCFDHRVADGAQAARFVRDLKEMLENPMTFMMRI